MSCKRGWTIGGILFVGLLTEGQLGSIPVWNSWAVRSAKGRAMRAPRANWRATISEVVRDGVVIGRELQRRTSAPTSLKCRRAVQAVVDGCRRGGRFATVGDRLPSWSEWCVRDIMLASSRWDWYEKRQEEDVWRALAKWPVKSELREFAWVVLWKKLVVRKRLAMCGLVSDAGCVWGDGEEDILHVVKGCTRQRWWCDLVYRM